MKRIPFLTILLWQITILFSFAPASALGSEQEAKALFDRGLAYDEAGDTSKALADYTAVIEMKDAPAEQKARALVNRGFVYGEAGDTPKKIADYTAVIGMKNAPAKQKAYARDFLNRAVAR
jgi:tetratricopeptide (TPR) repeat protein